MRRSKHIFQAWKCPYEAAFKKRASIYELGRLERDVMHFRMLYLVGLGLGDCKDITVKGLEAVRSSSKIYLEEYTSILTVGLKELVGI